MRMGGVGRGFLSIQHSALHIFPLSSSTVIMTPPPQPPPQKHQEQEARFQPESTRHHKPAARAAQTIEGKVEAPAHPRKQRQSQAEWDVRAKMYACVRR